MFIGVIQQVRHLGGRVYEATKDDTEGRVCSQKSDVSHTNSSLHIFL